MPRNSVTKTREQQLVELENEVTRLRHELESRAASESKLAHLAPGREVLDSVMVGVVQYAPDGSVIYANAYARQLIRAVGVDPDRFSLYDWRPMAVAYLP